MDELLTSVKMLRDFSAVIVIFYVIALSSYILMACLERMIDIVEKFKEGL